MAADAAEPRKKRYEVKDWTRYNEALVNRGDFTFYSEEVVDAWEHENRANEEGAKKNGRPFTYSDVAIETLLTIRELFRLPYRQTEGFGRALAKLLDAGVAIPHHTSLVKRAAKPKVSIDLDPAKGPIDVVVDSTGLKVFGDGEWRRKKHGVDKRRTFRKVHLAVDPESHATVAQLLTDSSVHDATPVKPLMEQVEQEVETFYGDQLQDHGHQATRRRLSKPTELQNRHLLLLRRTRPLPTINSDGPAKRRLLEIVGLNYRLDDVSLGVVWRKPFDALSEQPISENSRADRI